MSARKLPESIKLIGQLFWPLKVAAEKTDISLSTWHNWANGRTRCHAIPGRNPSFHYLKKYRRYFVRADDVTLIAASKSAIEPAFADWMPIKEAAAFIGVRHDRIGDWARSRSSCPFIETAPRFSEGIIRNSIGNPRRLFIHREDAEAIKKNFEARNGRIRKAIRPNKTETEGSKRLTVTEAARLFDFCPSTIHAWIRKKTKFEAIGNRSLEVVERRVFERKQRLVLRTEIEKLAESRGQHDAKIEDKQFLSIAEASRLSGIPYGSWLQWAKNECSCRFQLEHEIKFQLVERPSGKSGPRVRHYVARDDVLAVRKAKAKKTLRKRELPTEPILFQGRRFFPPHAASDFSGIGVQQLWRLARKSAGAFIKRSDIPAYQNKEVNLYEAGWLADLAKKNGKDTAACEVETAASGTPAGLSAHGQPISPVQPKSVRKRKRKKAYNGYKFGEAVRFCLLKKVETPKLQLKEIIKLFKDQYPNSLAPTPKQLSRALLAAKSVS